MTRQPIYYQQSLRSCKDTSSASYSYIHIYILPLAKNMNPLPLENVSSMISNLWKINKAQTKKKLTLFDIQTFWLHGTYLKLKWFISINKIFSVKCRRKNYGITKL